MASENSNMEQVAVPQTPMAKSTEAVVAGAPESDEKFFAALGYLAFLFVVPLIVKPKSAYCKFHARQSMVLFLTAIVVLVILGVIPWFGSILTMGLFALYVLAIYKAYNGDLWSIPVVSTFAGKMDMDKLYGKAGLAVSGIAGMKEKATQLATQASDAAKDLGKQETPSTSTETPEIPAAPAATSVTPPTTATSTQEKK